MGMYRKAALNDLRQKIGTKGVKELRKKLMEEEGAFVNYFNTLKIGERDVKAAKSRGVTILKAFTKKCDKAKRDAINTLSTEVAKETAELRKRRKSDSMLADFDHRIALTQRALTDLNQLTTPGSHFSVNSVRRRVGRLVDNVSFLEGSRLRPSQTLSEATLSINLPGVPDFSLEGFEATLGSKRLDLTSGQ